MMNQPRRVISIAGQLSEALAAALAMGILSIISLLASACNLPVVPTLTLPTLVRTPTPTATVTPAPPLTMTPVLTPGSVITLTLWFPPELAPSQQPEGKALAAQYQAFQEMYPNWKIAGMVKKATVPGGLLDYLQTTSRVVPAQMPDLVALDLQEVKLAAELGLLQPLDPLLPAEIGGDLFPVADTYVISGGQRIALPYEMDIRFLAYDPALVAEPPLRWRDVLSSTRGYLFPFGEGDVGVADAPLFQYYAAGGSLFDAEGQPAIDEATLASVLRFYQQGLDVGAIHTATLTTTTLAECWEIYLSGGAPLTEASMARYLADRSWLANTRYAPLPTSTGIIATISQGWAWCLVTPVPQRQQAAVALLSWLMEEENLVARSQAAYHLPLRRNALAESVQDDQLAAFIAELLERAYLRPPLRDYAALARLWHAAVQDVLLGNAKPEQAAQEVAAFVRSLREAQQAQSP